MVTVVQFCVCVHINKPRGHPEAMAPFPCPHWIWFTSGVGIRTGVGWVYSSTRKGRILLIPHWKNPINWWERNLGFSKRTEQPNLLSTKLQSCLWTSRDTARSPAGQLMFQSYSVLQKYLGLPRWLSGEESACQCRRHRRCRFYPWVRKIPWRRAWQPTPVFLPGKSHRQRSLSGYSPWGCKESDTTEHACTHTHTHLLTA